MNLRAFEKQKFEDRTEDVPVELLRPWYAPEDEPIWTIKALTGLELARVRAAQERGNRMIKTIDILADGDQDRLDVLRETMGIPPDVKNDKYPEYSMWCEAILLGTVSPEGLTAGIVAKLGKEFGDLHAYLGMKIINLTGMGRQPKKLNVSGATPVSETP